MRRLLITFGLALTLVLLNGSTAGARDSRRPPPLPTTSAILTASTTSTASPGAASLLPGAQTWSDGASSYDFGTNDTIEYSSNNVDTVPSVQADLKSGGLTLMRTWAYDSTDTDASIQQRVATIKNAGMQCMFMLGSTNDLTWMEHVVSLVKSSCHIFEFGNEPDNYNSPAGGKISTYTAQWISDIPKLRALDPGALFGGPVIMWSSSADGSQGSYPSDMAYFLAKTAAAGVRADFIDYHDYPCQKATTKAQCISMTPGDFLWNWDQVTGWENQYYGRVIPTGVGEYNFDPGDSILYSWGDDGSFMSSWTVAALNEIVALHMAFANEFTSLNYASYGYLDMFSDSPPYGPKGQFNAMVSEIRKYNALSTQILVPSAGAVMRGTAALDAWASGPSTVTGVSFDVSGGSLSKPVIEKAVATLYGWIALWKTTTAANGTYSLQSVATETGGATATSKKITVTVHNTG